MDESLESIDSFTNSSFLPSSASLIPIGTWPQPSFSAHAPPLSSHLMLTRAKVSILKTCHLANLGVLSSFGLLSSLLACTELKGFKSVVKDPAWFAAMDEEVQVLQNNRTWTLEPCPTNTNIMGSKWVFCTKIST